MSPWSVYVDCAGIFSVSTGSVRGMLVVAGSVDVLEILACFAVDGVHDSGNGKSDRMVLSTSCQKKSSS